MQGGTLHLDTKLTISVTELFFLEHAGELRIFVLREKKYNFDLSIRTPKHTLPLLVIEEILKGTNLNNR